MRGQRRQSLGRKGENAALSLLTAKGYRLIERNYRRRFGEVDLILSNADTLVFCEVKTSRQTSAVDHYGHRQQQRMATLILSYLAQHAWPGPVRVDLVILQAQKESPLFQAHHLENVLSFDNL